MNKTTENRLGGELRSHQAARHLLEELRRGRYADAAQLPSELELADVLGVSRTVVRDAPERSGARRLSGACARHRHPLSTAMWSGSRTAWTRSWNSTA